MAIFSKILLPYLSSAWHMPPVQKTPKGSSGRSGGKDANRCLYPSKVEPIASVSIRFPTLHNMRDKKGPSLRGYPHYTTNASEDAEKYSRSYPARASSPGVTYPQARTPLAPCAFSGRALCILRRFRTHLLARRSFVKEPASEA